MDAINTRTAVHRAVERARAQHGNTWAAIEAAAADLCMSAETVARVAAEEAHAQALQEGCYGIGCSKRGQCARYAAVELTTEPHTDGTCDTGNGTRPRFSARRAETAEA